MDALERRQFLKWMARLGVAAGAGALLTCGRDGEPRRTSQAPGAGLQDRRGRFTPVANVRDYGARGDGAADDTEPVQNAIELVGAAGGGTVYFPRGTYLLNTAITGSGLAWALTLHHDSITLRGDGDGSVLTTTRPDTSFIHIAGSRKRDAGGGYGEADLYPIRSAPAGAGALTLEHPADVEAVRSGDWVFIRTGQTTSWPGANEPDAEINQVVHRDASTGALTLRWPAAKPYAPEPYPPSHERAGRTAPFGLGVVTDRTLHDIAIRRLRFESRTSGYAVVGGGVVGLTIEDCTASTRMGFHSMGTTRGLTVRRCHLHINSEDDAWIWWLSTATGTTDVVIDRNTCSASCSGFLHLHEGSAGVQVTDNTFISRPSNADRPTVSIRARGYDLTLARNAIISSGNTAMLIVGDDVHASGALVDNVFDGLGNAEHAYYIANHATWRIEGNRVRPGLRVFPEQG